MYSGQPVHVRRAALLEQPVGAKLARHIRCPHLSQYWLGASVLSDRAKHMLLCELQPQLKQLMMARLADPTRHVTLEDLKEGVPDVPPSWFCPRRPPSKQDLSGGVQVQWVVPVADIRKACQDSFRQRKTVNLLSPDRTAPLGGLSWSINVCCKWDDEAEETSIGVYSIPTNAVSGGCYSVSFELECAADRVALADTSESKRRVDD